MAQVVGGAESGRLQQVAWIDMGGKEYLGSGLSV